MSVNGWTLDLQTADGTVLKSCDVTVRTVYATVTGLSGTVAKVRLLDGQGAAVTVKEGTSPVVLDPDETYTFVGYCEDI